MRLLALLVLLTAPALAGPRDHPVNPALSDEARDQPSVEQALASARKLFAALPGKRPEVIIRSLAVPFTDYLDGPAPHQSEAHCFRSQRYTDEHEGLPGAPQCLAAGLAKIAGELAVSLSAEATFPTLAALEAKHGAMTGPARALVKPLRHHVLVFASAAGARVVLAVRKAGTVSIDAVLADLRSKP